MPPRHGKSELCCKYLPAWYLGTFPDNRVIVAGYGDTFASEWGQKSRDVMQEHGETVFGLRVRQDSKANDNWRIDGAEGGMKTTGVGGPLTGRGADLLIIDDPVKNAKEAASEVYRNAIWDWWQSTAYTRLEPKAAVIVIQTRWHEDDLLGRILKHSEETGDRWRVLKLPAVGNDGSALWPERYDREALDKIRRNSSEYWWSALYQQDPTPREGMFFKTDNLLVQNGIPSGLRCVRAWDTAASDAKGDYTAGVLIGVDEVGRFYVLDVQRGQWGTDERNRVVRQTAEIDGPMVGVRGAQDPGSAGKDAALAFVRLLSGFSVRTEAVSGQKTVRADPFSAQVNSGNVTLIRGDWNRAYIEELRTFPLGMNDDQVDASADAFTELTRWEPDYSAGFEVEYART